MKRYNPFSQLDAVLTAEAPLLGQHPNSFFAEEDALRCVKNAIHALEHISQQLNTADSPTEKQLHAQLDQLWEEITSEENSSILSLK